MWQQWAERRYMASGCDRQLTVDVCVCILKFYDFLLGFDMITASDDGTLDQNMYG